MNTISIEMAIKGFPELLKDTLDTKKETIITSEKGDVVLIDQHSWEELKATIQLLKDQKSLKALLDGHIAREKNNVEGKAINQVFDDL